MKSSTWVGLLVGLMVGGVATACGSGGDDDDGATGTGGVGIGSGGTGVAGGAGSGGMAAGSGGAPIAGMGSGGMGSGGMGAGGSSGPVVINPDAPDIHAGPFVPTGQPLAAPDGVWTWVDLPDTTCRDGSMGGIALSLKPTSKKLMIFLAGGGACFDPITCLQNGAGFANVNTQTGEQTVGVFDRSNAMNPVKDWNFVFVPYCTGDVHIGTNPNGAVASVDGVLHFVGRLNMKAILNRLVPTFPGLEQVLLTGSSAGGFGASANVELVHWAFGDVPTTMLDDSGPAMSATYIPPCLQKQWRETWGFDGSVILDCGADCPDHDNYQIDYAKHLAKGFPDSMGGLVETTADGTITTFYGYGQNECTGSALTPMPADVFTAGLLEYRELMKMIYPKFGTYYITGTQHTWLQSASFYTQMSGSKTLVQWYADIVNGVAATHEGP